eukprot:8332947-Pyramimonas_sp.AAC.1
MSVCGPSASPSTVNEVSPLTCAHHVPTMQKLDEYFVWLLVGWLVGRLWLVGWLVGCGWLVGWSVVVGWLVGWLAGWLAGWL